MNRQFSCIIYYEHPRRASLIEFNPQQISNCSHVDLLVIYASLFTGLKHSYIEILSFLQDNNTFGLLQAFFKRERSKTYGRYSKIKFNGTTKWIQMSQREVYAPEILASRKHPCLFVYS